MDVAWDDFIVGMGYADQWPADLFIRVSHSFHQRAMGGPFNSFFYQVTSHCPIPTLLLVLDLITAHFQWRNLRRAVPGVKENEQFMAGHHCLFFMIMLTA
jgi:hypothetical protein